VGQGLIDSFLAMDTNMIHVSAKDELTQLAGKGDENRDVASKMRQAIVARARANGEDIDLASDDGGLNGGAPWQGPQAGSTCVVAVVKGDVLTVANAGDSRAVLCRKGKAVPLSRDHKPMDSDERARIQNAGGFVQEGRVNGSLALSRAIGDLEYKQSRQLPADKQVRTGRRFPNPTRRLFAGRGARNHVVTTHTTYALFYLSAGDGQTDYSDCLSIHRPIHAQYMALGATQD
jgi:protein phosphatase 1G|tara:strand:+ start:5003 stop:5701 length:699 start_codon:yes stop_codon:yes gene_type:complete